MLHNIKGDEKGGIVIQFNEKVNNWVVNGGLIGWWDGVETLCEVTNHEIVNSVVQSSVWKSKFATLCEQLSIFLLGKFA